MLSQPLMRLVDIIFLVYLLACGALAGAAGVRAETFMSRSLYLVFAFFCAASAVYIVRDMRASHRHKKLDKVQ